MLVEVANYTDEELREFGPALGTLHAGMSLALSSPAQIEAGLAELKYLPDPHLCQVVFLASRLQKPILAEGPAGVGKTELAKTLAELTQRPLIRLQCYEGLDEARALYEWNYKKQLLRIQAEPEHDWSELRTDIFSEEFLLTRPLLEAIRSPEPVVLLIDEVDRIEMETEALLLEFLSEFQISIPELGTITAKTFPLVVLTSNNTRQLSEALKRRCLFLFLEYPSIERETAILLARVPDLNLKLAAKIAQAVHTLRGMELKKPPSVSETIDWAYSLLELGREQLGTDDLTETLHILLKFQEDIRTAQQQLKPASPVVGNSPAGN